MTAVETARAKMKNKLLRIIALMLVSLMVLFAVSCAESGDDNESTDETTKDPNVIVVGTQPGNETEAQETYVDDDIPEGLDYQNKVTVLFWSDVERPEFEVEEPSINPVENAIYKRNMTTVQRLGLEELAWVGIPGSSSKVSQFTEQVGNSYNAGGNDYDIIASYSLSTGQCAIEGYMADLEAIDDTMINLDKPWWPQTLIDTVTIDDSIYFLSGDISTNLLHMMYAFFCNTDMLTDLRLPENPVQLALSNTWTVDKFMALVEGVFNEQNGDDKPSVGDRFGYVTGSLHIEALYQGAGFDQVVTDIDDVLLLADDFQSAKLSRYVNDLIEFMGTADVWKLGNNQNQFADGNALFTNDRMYFTDIKLGDVAFKYACLPTPMYDTKQDGYRTCIGNPFTLWGIMKSVESDFDRLVECTAVLECLASEAYRLTTPQIFEVGFKVKYSDIDAPETVECFDLIREGVVFDLGRIFAREIGKSISSMFASCIVQSQNWASITQSNLYVLHSSVREIVEKFDEHGSR